MISVIFIYYYKVDLALLVTVAVILICLNQGGLSSRQELTFSSYPAITNGTSATIMILTVILVQCVKYGVIYLLEMMLLLHSVETFLVAADLQYRGRPHLMHLEIATQKYFSLSARAFYSLALTKFQETVI